MCWFILDRQSMEQILIVILGMLAVMSSVAMACDVVAISNCISQLDSGQTDGLQEGIAAVPTGKQLRQMCSNMTEFRACYDPAAALCETDVMFSMTFGTIEKTVGYLCTEGYDDILRHDSCWSQAQVSADTKMCHVQQRQMLTSLQDLAANLNATDLRTVWCQILDNTTSCMTTAVSRSCQSEAICIMATMMSRSLVGLADFMQCPPFATGCSIPATTLSPPGNVTTSTDIGQPGNDVTTRRAQQTTDEGDKSAFRSIAPLSTQSRGSALILAFALAFLIQDR